MSAIKKHWATPYSTFTPDNGVDVLELTELPHNGKLAPRHYFEINANKNMLMDVVSDASSIVVQIDPSFAAEAAYLVNCYLKGILGADESKIRIEPSDTWDIIVTFYEGEAPSIPTAPRPKPGQKSHGRKGHHRSHHHRH